MSFLPIAYNWEQVWKCLTNHLWMDSANRCLIGPWISGLGLFSSCCVAVSVLCSFLICVWKMFSFPGLDCLINLASSDWHQFGFIIYWNHVLVGIRVGLLNQLLRLFCVSIMRCGNNMRQIKVYSLCVCMHVCVCVCMCLYMFAFKHLHMKCILNALKYSLVSFMNKLAKIWK